MQEQQGGDVEDAEQDDNAFDFDEEKIRKEFSEIEEEGITLTSVSTEVKDGWKYMNVKFTAKSLDALAETDFFEDANMSLTKDDEGNYVLLQKNSSDMMGGDDNEDMTPEMKQMMMQQMLPMLKGMEVKMSVKVPGKIIDTNAKEVNGDIATWAYDVDKDPSFITEMESMDDMRIVFASEGLDLPEIKAGAVGIDE